MMDRIRVVLVEDNRWYLDEVRLLLAGAPGVVVVGAYTTGEEALAGIIATQPDVALIDLKLPGEMSGVGLIRQVMVRGGKTECVVLTSYDDDTFLFPALQAGAVGYIVKSEASRIEVVQAIQEVIEGGAPMSMGIARRILQEVRQVPRAATPPQVPVLTSREEEILRLLAQGLTTRKVAQALYISYATVRCHQKNLYKKLQVHSLVEAVAVFRGEMRRDLA
jgi:DNA-binding NarL/FixJ family response regulator